MTVKMNVSFLPRYNTEYGKKQRKKKPIITNKNILTITTKPWNVLPIVFTSTVRYLGTKTLTSSLTATEVNALSDSIFIFAKLFLLLSATSRHPVVMSLLLILSLNDLTFGFYYFTMFVKNICTLFCNCICYYFISYIMIYHEL